MDSNRQSNWSYQPDAGGDIHSSVPQVSGSVSWSASEYIEHQKDIKWYVGLVLFFVVIASLVYLITGDKFTFILLVFVALASIAISKRKPLVKKYNLTSEGLKIDSILYPLDQFKSFSAVEEGAINSVWLRRFGRFKPDLVIYFAPDDSKKILDFLSKFLPYQEHQPDAVDRISKKIRF